MHSLNRKFFGGFFAKKVRMESTRTLYVVWSHYHKDDYKRADSSSAIQKIFQDERSALLYSIISNIECPINDFTSIDCAGIESKRLSKWLKKHANPDGSGVINKRALEHMDLCDLRNCQQLLEGCCKDSGDYTLRSTSNLYSVATIDA